MKFTVPVKVDLGGRRTWTQCPGTRKPVKLGYPCKCHGAMKRVVLARHYAERRRRDNELRRELDRWMEAVSR